ncbi:DNA primase TraC [Symmachiella dynata]|uniref:ArdC family protein n=1 Tax=Symmachiella dynata TaxID=2527995 RepID=UPI00118B282D|nr:zincin-like metallopeptidase domain-containing protein [Symmachiella dynata]QDT48886.1 DNA primase TraC [Symmachiella dynata]
MPSQSDIKKQITDQIIDSLTNVKLPPWRKPWSNDPNAGLNTSLSTGDSYRGINQLILQLSAARQEFQSKWWGTFNQINNCGASVRRGQKATKIILWKPIKRKRHNEQGNEVDDSFLVMREFCVFNAEQTTGLDQFQVGFAQPEEDTTERYEHADAVIEATNADVRYGGNAAFYSTGSDFIQCPFRHQFHSPELFFETMFHELTHWTESPERLNWDRANGGYAMGELIAEIGSCFMMGELGLPTADNMDNHAAYVKSWLKGMSDDPKFIFRAAAQATKAVDFLLDFSRNAEPVEVEAEEVPF